MTAPGNHDAAAARAATSGRGTGLLDAAPSPVPARVLARFGRASVLALRVGNRRQVFAPALSVHPLLPDVPTRSAGAATTAGGIGDALAAWSADRSVVGDPAWDWHLRRELAVRLLEQAASGSPDGSVVPGDCVLAWSRPGPAECEDADHGWWAAARSAAGEVDVPVACLLVVTRWGWWTLPEGPARRWARLRDHGGSLGPQMTTATRT